MSTPLADLSYDSLAFAIEKNSVEEFRFWSRWPGIELHVDGDRIWTISDIPSPLFNNIFRASFDPSDVEEAIEKVLAPFDERGVPVYWRVGRSCRPPNLGIHLESYGLKTAFITAAMAVDLETLPDSSQSPAGLIVEEVLSGRTFEQWLKFTAVNLNLPVSAVRPWSELHRSVSFGAPLPLRHFLGFLGGEPAAAASLFAGGGVAGLTSLVTKAEYRKKGIGTAVALSALKAGRESGFRAGVLFSTPEAAGIYRRMGFREYGRQWCYLWEGEAGK